MILIIIFLSSSLVLLKMLSTFNHLRCQPYDFLEKIDRKLFCWSYKFCNYIYKYSAESSEISLESVVLMLIKWYKCKENQY